MNCALIEEREMVERYVTGKLSAEESAAFEEHYLGCSECIERVEDAERLHRGFQRIAEVETRRAVEQSVVAGAVAQSRRGPMPFMTLILLGLAFLPAFWQRAQITELRESLDAVHSERSDLEARIAEVRSPSAATRVFSLSPFRDVGLGESPRHLIDLPKDGGWIVLVLDPGITESSSLQAVLRRDREEIWTLDKVVLDELGMAVISVHSSYLDEGELELVFRESMTGEGATLARYPLRVRIDS